METHSRRGVPSIGRGTTAANRRIAAKWCRPPPPPGRRARPSVWCRLKIARGGTSSRTFGGSTAVSEADDRVEDPLRDGGLEIAARKLFLLVRIGQVGRFHQDGRHVGRLQDAQRRPI